MKHLLLALCLLSCAACSPEPSAPASATVPVPPPPDVGDIGRFQRCEAEAKRGLSLREQCEIAAFRSRCTALDDCYVSCISSPSGTFVGGRCAHVCTTGPHRGAPPPDALASCASVVGRSGVDVE